MRDELCAGLVFRPEERRGLSASLLPCAVVDAG